MSYIIVAEVDENSEINYGANRANVDANVLSEHGGRVSFDVRGNFNPVECKAIVMGLCQSLVNAGYLEFRISHSY